jgi:hypothetical protein
MPGDLLAKVLEELEAAEQIAPQDGRWRGSEASATIRLVCSGWKYRHDAMVMRVVVRRAGGEPATDETVFVLAGRFPAIISLEFKLVSNHAWNAMTDEGMRTVCSLTALTTLDLAWCVLVSDEGLRAVSSLPSLTFLNLTNCIRVTGAGVQALRNTTAAPNLHIEWEPRSFFAMVADEDEDDWDDSDDSEDPRGLRVIAPHHCSWIMQSGMLMNHVHTVLHRVLKLSQPLSLSPRLLRLYDPCWGNGVRLLCTCGPLHTAPS